MKKEYITMMARHDRVNWSVTEKKFIERINFLCKGFDDINMSLLLDLSNTSRENRFENIDLIFKRKKMNKIESAHIQLFYFLYFNNFFSLFFMEVYWHFVQCTELLNTFGFWGIVSSSFESNIHTNSLNYGIFLWYE